MPECFGGDRSRRHFGFDFPGFVRCVGVFHPTAALSLDLRHLSAARILLIKPTALGDVVHTVPVLVKLRRRFPEAQIDWLITPENAELVRAHPALSRVVLFDRRGFQRQRLKALRDTARMLAGLRRTRYDLVIDLHGQLRSAAFTIATGAPVRIGFDRPIRRVPNATPRHGWAGARELSWLAYNRRLPIPTLNVHAIDRYLWLGEILGFDESPIEPKLHLPVEAEEQARTLMREHALTPQNLAVLAPGTMWETKHWRVEGFATVAQKLTEHGQAVVVVGTEKERGLARRIQAECATAIDLAGKTTPAELAALLRNARVCVTNDSGAMHIAVAMETPVVAIFGPTDPVQVGPYGHPGNVVRADLPCSPCNLRRLAQCPYDLKCMREVSAEQVWAKVDAVLAQPA